METDDNKLVACFKEERRGFFWIGVVLWDLSRDACEDVLQDVFLACIQHPDPDSVRNPRAFIREIFNNMRRGHFRGAARDQIGLNRYGIARGNPVHGNSIPDDCPEQFRKLHRILQTLSPRDRDLITQRICYSVPVAELAAQLSMGEWAVRKQVDRLLARLLRDHGDELRGLLD